MSQAHPHIHSVKIVAAPHYGGKGSVNDVRDHAVIDYSQHIINPHIRKHLHGLVRSGHPQFAEYAEFDFPEDWMKDAKTKAFFRNHVIEYVTNIRSGNADHYGEAMVEAIINQDHAHPIVTGPLYPGDIPPLIKAFGDRLELILIEVDEDRLHQRRELAGVTPEGAEKIKKEDRMLLEETLLPLINHLDGARVIRIPNNTDRESFVEALRASLL